MPLFGIPHENVAALERSEAFQMLRGYLAETSGNSFCSSHEPTDHSALETWILQRDIIHALITPIVQLYNRATALAQAALCSISPDDLELAFRGDGRSAFLFLQCLLSDEEDWCYTRGCPACAVLNTLSTESTLRIAITATLISSSSETDTTPASLATALEFPRSAPSTSPLPSFSFFLPALEHAVENDTFWGPYFWEHIFARAQLLETGIHALIAQCADLTILVTSPTASTSTSPLSSPLRSKRNFSTPMSSIPLLIITEADNNNAGIEATDTLNTGGSLRIRKSTFSRRQLRLCREEQELLERLVRQCWGAVVLSNALSSEQRDAVRAVVRGQRRLLMGGQRRRSLTCP
ncbi:hypothetical protein W97_07929 [Coniosporium apollinis CBS 100218]|uniref:Uncharacterized protein n=1 Tax=Coniosporium apollinis (strain CBS 100218) TaxID=1168221 RepID=R7Z436_CONA1|nr:uncharacterized protein W97_07929 [Coniosporium apollinis CBS 100218]EON68671.1 hypothetical protein W97_07929 [Coniosporium apollinis CBS 100218]